MAVSVRDPRTKERKLTLGMHRSIHVRQRREPGRLHIHAPVRKRNGDHHARKVQDVDGGGVPVVLELVVADGRRGRDGRDDGVQLAARLGLELSDLGEVLHLVVPLLELDGPCVVEADLFEVWIHEVGDVGDCGLPGEVEGGVNVLVLVVS